MRLIGASTEAFARTLAAALPRRGRAERSSRSGPISPGTEPRGLVVIDALARAARPRLDDPARRGAAPARLRRGVAARARRWAAAVAPGHAYEATSVAAAAPRSTGTQARSCSRRRTSPPLDAAVARVALDDLAAGCDVVVGVAHDARPYLVALPRPDAELLELAASGSPRRRGARRSSASGA